MRDELWAALSFAATILFGLMALAALLVAGLVAGNSAAVTAALLACAFAYGAQSFATFGRHSIAGCLQLGALVLWALGLLHLTGKL